MTRWIHTLLLTVLLTHSSGATEALKARFNLEIVNESDSTFTGVFGRVSGDLFDTLTVLEINPGEVWKQPIQDLDTGLHVIARSLTKKHLFFLSLTESVSITLRPYPEDPEVKSAETDLIDQLEAKYQAALSLANQTMKELNSIPRTNPRYYSIIDSLSRMREKRLVSIDSLITQFIGEHPRSVSLRCLEIYYRIPCRTLTEGALQRYQTEESFMVDHFWDAFKRPNRHAVNHPGFKSKVDVFFFMYAEKTREGLIKAAEQSITSFNSFPSARAVILKHVLMIFRQNAGEDLYLEIFERFASDCSDQLNLRDEAEYVEKLSLLKPGLPAPEIVSSDLSGTSRRLSEFKGEPVLLFFWASWCPHCVGFIPRLKEVFSSHNLNVRIVAISLDDDQKSWQDAVNQHSMSHWINLSDLKRWKGSATQSYCVHRTPTMVLINSDGLIVARDPSPEDLPGLIR